MDSLISPLIWNFYNSSVPYGMNKSWRKNNSHKFYYKCGYHYQDETLVFRNDGTTIMYKEK